jgi:hypothetical protein
MAARSIRRRVRSRLEQTGNQLAALPTGVDLAKELNTYLEAIKKT